MARLCIAAALMVVLLGLNGTALADGPQRAPDEMTGPVLRVSPHLDATVDDLEALAAAL